MSPTCCRIQSDRAFRSVGSYTIKTLGELESVDMRLIHEAIDGA